MAQLEACGCCKNSDIYHGTLEGTQDIMGLTKSLNYSGELWMWHCYVTMYSKNLLSTSLSSVSFPLPLPFLQSVSSSFCLSTLVFLFLIPHLTPSSLLSIVHPFRTHAASSTKTTYVSYSNHAIWRDHRTRRKGLDRRGGLSRGQCQAKEGAVVLSRLAEELADRPSAQWNPSMRHFVLFRIKPQRGGTT